MRHLYMIVTGTQTTALCRKLVGDFMRGDSENGDPPEDRCRIFSGYYNWTSRVLMCFESPIHLVDNLRRDADHIDLIVVIGPHRYEGERGVRVVHMDTPPRTTRAFYRTILSSMADLIGRCVVFAYALTTRR